MKKNILPLLKKKFKRLATKIVAGLPFSCQVYLFKEYGFSFFINRAIYKYSERFQRDKVIHFQNNHLKKLISHAATKVPFYRDEFEKRGIRIQDINTVEDLQKLPIINKNLMKDNIDRFRADDFEKYHPLKRHTSGSTGNPFTFYTDKKNMLLNDVIGWRRFNWAGFRFNDSFAVFRQPIGYRIGKIDNTRRFFYDPVTKMLEINTIFLGREDLKKVFALLNEFQVSVLITYPSLLVVLANFAKEEKIHYQFKAIVSGSEKLYPFQRKLASEVFQTNVYHGYGMEERLAYAFECSYSNMHVFFEIGIIEILKDNKPCRPGEIGELVLTGLHNYSMPFIRYAIGDYGCFRDLACPCGSEMPIVEITGGREKDLIVTSRGIRCVNPELLFLQKDSEKITEFQIFQKSKTELVLRIVPRTNLTQSDKKYLEKSYQDLLNNEMDVRVEIVDRIQREPSGKFRYVLSEIYQDEYEKALKDQEERG